MKKILRIFTDYSSVHNMSMNTPHNSMDTEDEWNEDYTWNEAYSDWVISGIWKLDCDEYLHVPRNDDRHGQFFSYFDDNNGITDMMEEINEMYNNRQPPN